MKSSQRLLIVLVLLIGLTMVGRIVAQETTAEPEILTPNLVILADGEPVSGELDVNNPLHARLYTFGATTGDTVSITMNTSDADLLDPYLLVYSPSGNLIAFDDDSGGMPNALIDRQEIVETGNYYILATTFTVVSDIFFPLGVDLRAESEDASPVAFDITVTDNIDPEVAPNFIPATLGETLELSATEESLIQYVVFAVTEGSPVTLAAQSDTVDTLLYLFDTDGNLIAVNDDIDFTGDNTDSLIVDIAVPADGVYLAFVTVAFYQTAFDEPLFTIGDITLNVE